MVKVMMMTMMMQQGEQSLQTQQHITEQPVKVYLKYFFFLTEVSSCVFFPSVVNMRPLLHSEHFFFIIWVKGTAGPAVFPWEPFFMAEGDHRCSAPWQTAELYTDNNTRSEAVMSVNTPHLRSQTASVCVCVRARICVCQSERASHSLCTEKKVSLYDASALNKRGLYAALDENNDNYVELKIKNRHNVSLEDGLQFKKKLRFLII